MFKIIESISMDPIRLPMYENMSFFRPGFVCKIIDNLYCDVSDGSSVFGILGEIFEHKTKINEHEIYIKKFVNVYPQRMIFRTNEYMMGEYYKGGTKLYVNNRGLLTAVEPYKDAVYYGRVISPPNVGRQWLEALWV